MSVRQISLIDHIQKAQCGLFLFCHIFPVIVWYFTLSLEFRNVNGTNEGMRRKKALSGEPMRHGTDSLYKKLPFFWKVAGVSRLYLKQTGILWTMWTIWTKWTKSFFGLWWQISADTVIPPQNTPLFCRNVDSGLTPSALRVTAEQQTILNGKSYL